jgi:hypothetical protein
MSALLAVIAATAALHVSPAQVHAGDRVHVFGNVGGGCAPGGQVTLLSRAFRHTDEFAGVPAVFATVRADGSFSVHRKIPRTRAPKRYTLTARCGGGNLGILRHIRVLAPR